MNSNSAVAVKPQAGVAKSTADEPDNTKGIAWWDGPMVVGGVTLATLLGIWEYVSQTGAVTAYVLPAPSALVAAMYEIFTQGFPEGITAPSHIWLTLQRILLGFILAGACAIPLGIVIGSIPVLEKLTGTVVTFGRSIAAISLLPLFIAWFGIGELSKVLLIALGAFWVIITNTITGVQMVDPVLIRAAQSMDTQSVAREQDSPKAFLGLRRLQPRRLPAIETAKALAITLAPSHRPQSIRFIAALSKSRCFCFRAAA